ncbi:hypothetical protein JXD38_06685 [candidate division WOR-3 bacterium]|nr:hypothetical protein [candidate division WOR-3 bacterium]
MRTRRFMLALTLLAAVAAAGSVNPAWIQHYSGPGETQFNGAADSYLDTLSGNLYVCGAGELAANPGGTDLLVMKYRPDGTRAWINGFSGTGASQFDVAQALAVDSAGNVYIAGRADNSEYDDAVWAKYDSNGVELWRVNSGMDGDDEAFGIAIGNAGDVYVCGTDSGYGYLTGYMVARLDPSNGDTLWTRTYVLDTTALFRRNPGDMHPDFFEDYDLYDNAATAIARSPDSGVVTTGFGLDFDREREWWTMKFTPSGVRSWAATYHYPSTTENDDDVAFAVAVADNGEIYAVGFDYYETGSAYQGYNYAIVRYSATGSRLSYRSLDVSAEHGDDYAFSVALDDSNPQNVYVTGVLAYPWPLNEQVATMKFNNTLTSRWGPAGATYGLSDEDDRGYSVCYSQGRIYVTGRSTNDLFVLGYSAANASPKDTLWSYRYDDADSLIDFGATICAADSDHVYVSGEATHAGPWTSLFTARLRYGHPELAVTGIVAPQGTYDHNDTVIPRATITNNGDVIPMFHAFMYIGLSYGDTIQVYDGPAPGQSAEVSFKPWAAHPTGLVPERCSLEVEGDTNPSNDFFSDTVQVFVVDVGCRTIVSPTGATDSGTNVTPVARFRNFGMSTQTFPVWFRIDTAASVMTQGTSSAAMLQVYEDSATITLAAQESTDFSFENWPASPPGTYGMKAFTGRHGDDNQANDTANAQLVVRPGPGIADPGDLADIPREFSLGSPRPNPAVGRTLVPFALPIRAQVSIQVYDASGAFVRTLTAAELPAGYHRVSWDGTDERGLRVNRGAYFCRLQTPGPARIVKLVVSE